jgi:hypothetical protein
MRKKKEKEKESDHLHWGRDISLSILQQLEDIEEELLHLHRDICMVSESLRAVSFFFSY